jgi:hypothetical protein
VLCGHDFLRKLKGGSDDCRCLHEGPSCRPAAWLIAQDCSKLCFLQPHPAFQVYWIRHGVQISSKQCRQRLSLRMLWEQGASLCCGSHSIKLQQLHGSILHIGCVW